MRSARIPFSVRAALAASLTMLCCLAAAPARACMSLAYAAGPAKAIRFDSVAEVLRGEFNIALDALGTTSISLPLKNRSDRWHLSTEPVLFVLPRSETVKQGSTRQTVFSLNYQQMHPYQAKLLAQGEHSDIESTHWKGRDEIVIPVSLIYYSPGKKPQSAKGKLTISRGEIVALPSKPVLIELDATQVSQSVSSGRPFYLVAGKTITKQWKVTSATVQQSSGAWVELELREESLEDKTSFVAIASGVLIKIVLTPVASSGDGASAPSRTIDLRVYPTPKC